MAGGDGKTEWLSDLVITAGIVGGRSRAKKGGQFRRPGELQLFKVTDYFKIAAGGWEQEERLEAWLVDLGEAAYYPVNKEKTYCTLDELPPSVDAYRRGRRTWKALVGSVRSSNEPHRPPRAGQRAPGWPRRRSSQAACGAPLPLTV